MSTTRRSTRSSPSAGFITFSPQNLYIFEDRFRTLQRKANPIGKTLFSIIVPQHQQIVDWLETLPQVDPERIAFYGLSYGGRRPCALPPLVTDYCLSICSADFNEWVDKNASTRNPHSYAGFGEYEFDLGNTFNYAEMAALIAPRPFMVERGHFDGVASDETVAWEYAKVRFLYAAKLKIPDRTEIEWFDGPHSIHGVSTYDFLAPPFEMAAHRPHSRTSRGHRNIEQRACPFYDGCPFRLADTFSAAALGRAAADGMATGGEGSLTVLGFI